MIALVIDPHSSQAFPCTHWHLLTMTRPFERKITPAFDKGFAGKSESTSAILKHLEKRQRAEGSGPVRSGNHTSIISFMLNDLQKIRGFEVHAKRTSSVLVERDRQTDDLKRQVARLDRNLWLLIGAGKPFEDQKCSLCGRGGPIETFQEWSGDLYGDRKRRKNDGEMYFYTGQDVKENDGTSKRLQGRRLLA